MFKLIVIFAFLLPHLANADAPISWETKYGKVVDGEIEVFLRLSSPKPTKIRIASASFRHLDGETKKLTYKKFLDLKKGQEFNVSKDKTAEIKIMAPTGLVQIPVEAYFGNSSTPVEISFFVKAEQQKVKVKEVLIHRRNAQVYLGLGTTLLDYTQASTVNQNPIEFKDNKVPSFSFRGNILLNENLGFSSYLYIAPSSIDSSSSLSFNDDSYLWMVYGLEGIHTPDIGNFGNLKFSYRAGIQMLQVPFVIRTTTNNVGSSEANTMGNIGIGPMVSYLWNENWSAEAYSRINIPVYNGYLFDTKSTPFFDLSVNIFWRPSPNSAWTYSVQWFYQKMKFDYTHNDIVLRSPIPGTLDIAFTSLDFKVGYSF